MAKLIGYKKINTAVFISGNGSNLKSLIKFSKTRKSPIFINLIISNNSKAKGLKLGKIHKIKKKADIIGCSQDIITSASTPSIVILSDSKVSDCDIYQLSIKHLPQQMCYQD